MATCSRCGNPVEFRYVDGRCIPLHLWGGCTNAASGSTTDYSGYSRSEEACCFLTNCPECSEPVFFLRHNGGSVWIDPPLGPPWFKHPCMDTGPKSTTTTRRGLASEKPGRLGQEYPEDAILGVVKETEVSSSRQSSVIKIETEKNVFYVLFMRHNAGFLTGKLVLYRPRDKTVTIFEEETYIFAVLVPLFGTANGQAPSEKIICPECHTVLNSKNLTKHLRNQHWFRICEQPA